MGPANRVPASLVSPWRRIARYARRVRKARARKTPPPTPRGWQSGPPDFVGVGAQHSGTSWWYECVTEHPGIVRAGFKELHYFDRFSGIEFSPGDADKYHRFFPRPAGCITGEWTPRYMHDFWTPPLLRRAAPNAKLLVLLRNPIDRYVSLLGRRLGWGELTADSEAHLANDTLHRGLYWEQLSWLLEHFERRQILVLQYERCVANPLSELQRTYDFLEVEPRTHRPESIDRLVNKRKMGVEPSGELIAVLSRRFASDVRRLRLLVPEIDLRLWPPFESLVDDFSAEEQAAAR